MDIGKPVRIHIIPEPKRIRKELAEPNPYYAPDKVDPEGPALPVPNWPIRKKEDAEVEK